MTSVFEELDKILSPSRLISDGVPAVSIAILENGQISSHVITNTDSVNTSTIFQACSISKAVTALAVARLVDQGRLSYDMPIMEHLPEAILFSLTGPNTRSLPSHISLSHLLSHTAGISQGGFIGYPTNVKPPTLDQLICGDHPSNSSALRLIAPPGSQFSYSGGGFCILQRVLTSLLNMPFPQIMRDLVLAPLNMTRSHFGDLPPGEKDFSPAHYTAHSSTESPYHVLVEEAAAGLWTTPSDLLLAVSAIQKSLSGEHGSFLSQKTAKEMLSPIMDVGEMGCMARGWIKRADMFGHDGSNFPGYRCTLVGAEDGSERGISIMTGSQYGTNTISKIVQAVVFLKGWKAVELLGGNNFVPYAAKEGTGPDEMWKNWIAEWEEGWKIVEDQGQPKVIFGELPPLKMVPAATPSVDGSIVFVVEDLRLGVMLVMKDGEKLVQLLQGLESPDRQGARKTLKQVMR